MPDQTISATEDDNIATFLGKHALVIGGGRNIGRCVAREFARRGARITVADLDAAGADEAAALIADDGGEAIGTGCDVTSATSVAAAIAAAEARFGAIDILVNNAGILHSGNAEDLPVAEWERMFGVNLFGMVRAIEIVLPKMIARGGGHIVTTASFAGAYPFGINRLGYAASKAGVISMSQNLALYLMPKGIRVSCLIPGPVATTVMDGIRIFTPDVAMHGPGDDLEVKQPETVARTLADGMATGRILVPTDEALWGKLQHWAADPDAAIRERADAFARGERGVPKRMEPRPA